MKYKLRIRMAKWSMTFYARQHGKVLYYKLHKLNFPVSLYRGTIKTKSSDLSIQTFFQNYLTYTLSYLIFFYERHSFNNKKVFTKRHSSVFQNPANGPCVLVIKATLIVDDVRSLVGREATAAAMHHTDIWRNENRNSMTKTLEK